jgi:hypothetical protein
MARTSKAVRCGSALPRIAREVVAAVVVVLEVEEAADTAAIEATAVAGVVAEASPDWGPIATDVGVAWAAELVRQLRAAEREIVGSWPGTMSEARMRVLHRLHRKLDVDLLDDLARIATLAARREWHQICQPDLEV